MIPFCVHDVDLRYKLCLSEWYQPLPGCSNGNTSPLCWKYNRHLWNNRIIWIAHSTYWIMECEYQWIWIKVGARLEIFCQDPFDHFGVVSDISMCFYLSFWSDFMMTDFDDVILIVCHLSVGWVHNQACMPPHPYSLWYCLFSLSM